jgi:hypothetical protein
MAKKPEAVQVKVRMPKDLHRRIEREAGRRGQTINAEILGRLERDFRTSETLIRVEKKIHKAVGAMRGLTTDIDKERTIAIAAGVNVDNDLDYAAWALAKKVGVPKDVVLRVIQEEARKYDKPRRNKAEEAMPDHPPTTKENKP